MDQTTFNNLIYTNFQVLLSVKLNHWTTVSYARHKATDSLLSNLTSNFDKFVEVAIGKFNTRPTLPETSGLCVNLNNIEITDNGIERLLNNYRDVLERLIITDTSLLNIRDEMIGDINQTLYLFTLR